MKNRQKATGKNGASVLGIFWRSTATPPSNGTKSAKAPTGWVLPEGAERVSQDSKTNTTEGLKCCTALVLEGQEGTLPREVYLVACAR